MTTLRVLFIMIAITAASLTAVEARDFAERKAEIVSSHVDTMPEFPGGDDSMMAFIVDNLRLDRFAPEQMADVTVGYVVATDGSVESIEVSHSSPVLASEICRVMKKMPRFAPATLSGCPVAYRSELPLSIEISEE